jgi:hypothetical protein
MQGIIATLAITLAALVAGGADGQARSPRKQPRQSDGYARKYPYATQRQLRNARAYDRREYFEQDSPTPIPWAVAVGGS